MSFSATQLWTAILLLPLFLRAPCLPSRPCLSYTSGTSLPLWRCTQFQAIFFSQCSPRWCPADQVLQAWLFFFLWECLGAVALSLVPGMFSLELDQIRLAHEAFYSLLYIQLKTGPFFFFFLHQQKYVTSSRMLVVLCCHSAFPCELSKVIMYEITVQKLFVYYNKIMWVRTFVMDYF